MTTASNLRTGGQILVDALRLHGADMAFCLPGESYLAVLDALYDVPGIKTIVCRQEGGAAMMAEAYGKLTGRPGICMVTRGPGATNASAGLHIAFQDSTPMILLVGQVGRDMVEREAFQELDYRRMFGQLAKWVAQIDDPARIPEFVSRAFYTATSGRPGPVVLALPEDMLTERAAAPEVRPYRRIETYPGLKDLSELRNRLSAAERPVLLVGGSGWDNEACAALIRFVERNHLPVAATFRSQDIIDNCHPNYVGDVGIGINPKLAERIKAADLLVVVGARLGEMTTGGYSLLDIPRPAMDLVHVYPDPEELGRVYQPDQAINATVRGFASLLDTLVPVDAAAWADTLATAKKSYETHTTPPEIPGPLQMGQVMEWLNANLKPDSIITNGAGNYTVWVHRFYKYRRRGNQLAPTSGSMGYGLPAAVAAKAVHPDRTVVCFAGDGCYMMHGQELATAMQYGLPIIVLVINNGMFGTIRMHQEREYPGRVHATGLSNPDFAALARAYGGFGEVVERAEDFGPAFGRAEASGLPAILELRLDPEAITPAVTLSGLREAALKG